ncbi:MULTISPECIES: metallophosphoesterase family protein [Micromonospora]|uniref:metallophosphoesterase family protein n=1 Tax=Micromonospora TaxID=1873 RepID=UPI000CE45633|nr:MULTISPECIES: metallophosphoesterase [Micromonospora]MBP1781343.1 putative MPP superfamily phosphohydrolase [Micromonospora sp. HB375]MBQ1060191.1 metallophosphoesterase [Micromonospora sp. C41]MDH6466983.1 putative MPP superfamily phosphohydrolase [Micromonospora sp. H404/HB375]NHO79797.1 metallophosphoesterase [Micromonospora sp. CMU55-4]PPA59875.1 metallophosphoesterase [Micromonospora chalcea]
MDGHDNEEHRAGDETSPGRGPARRWTAWRPGHRLRRLGVVLALFAVTLGGIVVGTYAGGHVGTDIGPFRAELKLSPSLSGGTTVDIPPLGALLLDSHDGPAYLTVEVGALDQGRTEALIDDPASISRASQSAVQDVRDGVMRLGLRTLASAVLATLILAALVFRDVRRTAWAGGLALVITAGSLGVAATTLRPQAIEEPRYEGLLVNAPAIVGDARRIANDYTKYAEQLQRLVGNVSKLYTTVSALPVVQPSPGTTRVLHVSDMHLNPTGWQLIRTVVEQFGIDVVIDTGDMTDWGSEPEASFVGSIGLLKKPYVFIRGNHDSPRTAAAVAQQPNAIVLNNSITTVGGLTIAGIGDPRFTPDKETSPAGSGLTAAVADQVIGAGEQLAATVEKSPRKVDIALVHDPASAGPLSGTCPLVLSGHTHARQVSKLPEVPGKQPTTLMVEGSTGGAGLRGLEGEKPTPLTMTVLYFDQQKLLQAYDEITVGGTGQSQVNLERHVIRDPAKGDQVPVTPTPTRGPSESPSPGTTTLSPTATPTR